VRGIAFVLLSIVLLGSCGTSNKTSDLIRTNELISTLDSTVVSDSTKFMFAFEMINMTTTQSLDSIWKATSTIQGMRGMRLSLADHTCKFYMDSFSSYKELFAAIQTAGYHTEDVFTMKGPGLTCDIPSENDGQDQEESVIEPLSPSLENFKQIFNQNTSKVRIVSIPNPACLACVKGQRFINGLFTETFPLDTNLMGLTVWISINGWGTRSDAQRLAPENKDTRMRHFWDEDMNLGKHFRKPLGLDKDYETAWDVYLVYAPGIEWLGDEAPKPSFWMHQLAKESGADRDLFMNADTFEQQLSAYLSPFLPINE